MATQAIAIRVVKTNGIAIHQLKNKKSKIIINKSIINLIISLTYHEQPRPDTKDTAQGCR